VTFATAPYLTPAFTVVRAALEEFFLLLDDGPQKDRLDAYVAAV